MALFFCYCRMCKSSFWGEKERSRLVAAAVESSFIKKQSVCSSGVSAADCLGKRPHLDQLSDRGPLSVVGGRKTIYNNLYLPPARHPPLLCSVSPSKKGLKTFPNSDVVVSSCEKIDSSSRIRNRKTFDIKRVANHCRN